MVSIHAPAWGATRTNDGGYVPVMSFQSTHPRGVRRVLVHALRRGRVVSIHAPAWGATITALDGRADTLVSIHAPAWGATRNGISCMVPP